MLNDAPAGRSHQPHPERDVQLLAAGGGDVAEVEDPVGGPAEALQQLGDLSLRLLRRSRSRRRRARRATMLGSTITFVFIVFSAFDHPRLGKGALDPFAEAVVDGNPDDRRRALREVERVGDVDENLPREVLRACGVQPASSEALPFVQLKTSVAVSCVRPRTAPRQSPAEREPMSHVVAELAQLPRDRRAHDSGSENADPHEAQSTIALVTEIRKLARTKGRSWPRCRSEPRSPGSLHIFPPERYPYPREGRPCALVGCRRRALGRGR